MGTDIHLQVEKRVGGKWQHVPWLPMEREQLIKSKPEVVKGQDNLGFAPKGGELYFTTVRWEVTYWEAAHTFYVESIPVLRKLARQVGSTDDVRIVFGFDS